LKEEHPTSLGPKKHSGENNTNTKHQPYIDQTKFALVLNHHVCQDFANLFEHFQENLHKTRVVIKILMRKPAMR